MRLWIVEDHMQVVLLIIVKFLVLALDFDGTIARTSKPFAHVTS